MMRNGGRSANQQQQPKPVEPVRFDQKIVDDMDCLIDVGLAERYFGFKRNLDPATNQWVWNMTGQDEVAAINGASENMALGDLPKVRGCGFMLAQHMDTLCDDLTKLPESIKSGTQYVWQCQRMLRGDENSPKFMVKVARILADKTGEEVAVGRADDPATAFAVTMLICGQYDFAKAHRELFPAKYLHLVS